ncbi:FAD-dependent oxidoreductase [Amycolatopsis sp. NPDC051373]|uniref:FAD-dependent oxidoreductase n=1 Tax=Amycolatopsis sp. NPDC051373 TaxID=3155801 RepID=UPI00344C2485
MAGSLGDRVRLGEPVLSIRQTPDGVEVTTGRTVLRAARVVVAVPPTVLECGHGEAPGAGDRDVLHLGRRANPRRLGYSREFAVEQWMRDAKLEEGTSDIMRLVISRRL